MTKKTTILFFLLAAGCLFLVPQVPAQEKSKAGILLFSRESHYQVALKGFFEQMELNGFDGNKVEFDIRNAEGRKENVLEIINEFKQKGLNLIAVFGTPAAITVVKEIKDIPVVFSMVFDPIGAGLVKSWESSGNNTTGSSTWIEMSSLVNVARKICPVKRLGVIYTEEEKQTVIQLNELTKLEKKMGFTVVPANLAKAEDAQEVTNRLVVSGVDCIYVSGGTVVGNSLKQILEIAKIAKIPTVSHLQERVENGVLLGVAANSSQLGKLAGEKASLVLQGVKPAYIPVEPLEQYDILFNMKTAREININIPDSFLAIVAKIIG